MSAKEQIGRLESLLDRVRSRARHAGTHAGTHAGNGAAAAAAAAAPVAAKELPHSDLAVPVVSPSATPPAPHAPVAPRRPSVAPPLPPQALGHGAAAAPPASVVAPPSSAVPSTMELGADDMIESVSPAHAEAEASASALAPSSRIPESRHATAPPPAAGADDIDVEVTTDEEAPAPSSARRPKSERAHPMEAIDHGAEASEDVHRPQTTPPESGRQVASSASPSVPAESGKRASVPAVSFDAHAEDGQPQIASGRAAATNPATFVGAPRRAPSTFGELLDAALSF